MCEESYYQCGQSVGSFIISKIVQTNYYELGECYENVFKKYDKAYVFYKKAYEQGSSESLLTKLCKVYTIHSRESGLREYETEMILERRYSILTRVMERDYSEAEGEFFENYAWYANLRERYATETESLKKALESYKNNLCKLIRTYNLLVGAYYNRSQKVQALDYAQCAYNLLCKDLPLNVVANTKYNLGLACSEFDDRQHDAIRYYSEALEDFKRFYNNNAHFDIGSTLWNMGVAYEALEDYTRASEYEKAAQIILGDRKICC